MQYIKISQKDVLKLFYKNGFHFCLTTTLRAYYIENIDIIESTIICKKAV